MIINDNFLRNSVDVELERVNTSIVDLFSLEKSHDNLRISLNEHLNCRPEVTVGQSAHLEVTHIDFTVLEN